MDFGHLQMDKFVEDLTMMGFSEELAKEAVEKSGSVSIENAIAWIEQNPKEDDKMTFIKCDECGKRFKDHHEASFHAYKSEHSKFSEERGEALPPLTEEELRSRKGALMERIKKFRAERRKLEEKLAFEEEKKRRSEGKYKGNIRAEMKEIEMRKAAEERMREKQMDREIKERLLRQIKADRDAMKKNPTKSVEVPKEVKKVEIGDFCKIQVRWPDGRCFSRSFRSEDTLRKVYDFVLSELNDSSFYGFTFQSTFPKKSYSQEDYGSTLKDLGLCPSACLFVRL